MKNVCVIGGHGKVALLATEKLVGKGHTVTSVVRNPDHVAELSKLGADTIVEDITRLSQQDWARVVESADVVVWSAGAGGKGDTLAVDRDAALELIKTLEALDDAPELIMVSYVGARTNSALPSEGSWYDYVEAKKTVDNRLFDSKLKFLVLGPATLTDEPSEGIEILSDERPVGEMLTSRELVADVILEVINRQFLPTKRNPLEFIDGDGSLTKI